jgi:hypothetical protein
MIFSAEEIKSFHRLVLFKEILYIQRMVLFFECNGSPVTKEQELWKGKIETVEDVERLKASLLELRIIAENLQNEISFSTTQGALL